MDDESPVLPEGWCNDCRHDVHWWGALNHCELHRDKEYRCNFGWACPGYDPKTEIELKEVR